MADRADVTFSMTMEDLNFLAWAMGFLRGGPHGHEALVDEWEERFERALDEHFPIAEDFTLDKGRPGTVRPAMKTPCPRCGEPTAHRSAGVDRSLREPDGRVYQLMACAECGTSTKVYFTEGTREFQDNLDAPDDAGA